VLLEKLAGQVGQSSEFRGTWALEVDRGKIAEAVKILRDDLGFDYLIDVLAIDHFGEEPRFEVVYEISKFEPGAPFVRLRTRVSEDRCSVPTITHLFGCADWIEREVWDMHGIRFDGHPDLRRILMWDGYPYHPLRKDFPLEGRGSEVPGEAFSEPAPLAGGPFVSAHADHMHEREPRAHPPEIS
jgi:NADH-quinone oxidoreductase subunit C